MIVYTDLQHGFEEFDFGEYFRQKDTAHGVIIGDRAKDVIDVCVVNAEALRQTYRSTNFLHVLVGAEVVAYRKKVQQPWRNPPADYASPFKLTKIEYLPDVHLFLFSGVSYMEHGAWQVGEEEFLSPLTVPAAKTELEMDHTRFPHVRPVRYSKAKNPG